MKNSIHNFAPRNLTPKEQKRAAGLAISAAEYVRRDNNANLIKDVASRVGRGLGKAAVVSGIAAGGLIGYNKIVPDIEPSKSVKIEVSHNDANADGKPDRIPAGITHTVESGENPYMIADEFNVRKSDTLDMANSIQEKYADDKGNIHPGQTIQITPEDSNPTKGGPAPSDPEYGQDFPRKGGPAPNDPEYGADQPNKGGPVQGDPEYGQDFPNKGGG